MLFAPNEELVLRWRGGDVQAGNTLVRQNQAWIYKIARKYRGAQETEDAFQQGCLGFLEAMKKWRPDGGGNFVTYSTYWISCYVRRSALKSGGPLRMWTSQRTKTARSEIYRMLQQRQVTVEELFISEVLIAEACQRTGLTPDDLRDLLPGFLPSGGGVSIESGDSANALDNWSCLHHEEISVERIILDEEVALRVRNALKVLAARGGVDGQAAEVLRLRWLDVPPGKSAPSLAVVGEHLGVTRSRVASLESIGQRHMAELLRDCAEEVLGDLPEDDVPVSAPRPLRHLMASLRQASSTPSVPVMSGQKEALSPS